MMFAVAVLLMVTNANAQHLDAELEEYEATWCYNMDAPEDAILPMDQIISVKDGSIEVMTRHSGTFKWPVGDIHYRYIHDTGSNIYQWKSVDGKNEVVYQSNLNIHYLTIKVAGLRQMCTESYHKTLALRADAVGRSKRIADTSK